MTDLQIIITGLGMMWPLWVAIGICVAVAAWVELVNAINKKWRMR